MSVDLLVYAWPKSRCRRRPSPCWSSVASIVEGHHLSQTDLRMNNAAVPARKWNLQSPHHSGGRQTFCYWFPPAIAPTMLQEKYLKAEIPQKKTSQREKVHGPNPRIYPPFLVPKTDFLPHLDFANGMLSVLSTKRSGRRFRCGEWAHKRHGGEERVEFAPGENVLREHRVSDRSLFVLSRGSSAGLLHAISQRGLRIRLMTWCSASRALPLGPLERNHAKTDQTERSNPSVNR